MEMAHIQDVHLAPKAGTQADASDMKRMGKLQELNVSYLESIGKAYDGPANCYSASLLLHNTHRVRGDCGFGVAFRHCVGVTPDTRRCTQLLTTLNSTGALALTNGGIAGAIWVFLGVCFGMFSVVVSMAEMASMYVIRSTKTGCILI